jgi:hypothetical protein
MDKKVRNIVGHIPDPDELYGREDLLANLWRQIEGNNILLLAPRRFGKSGVMRHVLLLPKEGYFPISFDLEDVTTPEEFVWRISRELLSRDKTRLLLRAAHNLPKAISDWAKDTFEEIGFERVKVRFKDAIKSDWYDAARGMLLELEKADDTIIFIFDELPSMLDNMIRHCGADVAGQFMAWFRTVRLGQKDVLRRHRFIVAGSIGIDAILRHIDAADKLVDFQRFYVEPLRREYAVQLADDLSRSLDIGWNEALSDHLLHLIGLPVPYFIHLFFSQLAQLPCQKHHSIAQQDLDDVYQKRVLGPSCKHYFEHYRVRLRSRYGATGEKAAISVLCAVAGSAHGFVSRSALYDVYRKARGKPASDIDFNSLLGDLENDWYLELDANTNEYHFMLNVIRDWWKRWFPLAGSTRLSKRIQKS